jgi:hypothetical protein
MPTKVETSHEILRVRSLPVVQAQDDIGDTRTTPRLLRSHPSNQRGMKYLASRKI